MPIKSKEKYNEYQRQYQLERYHERRKMVIKFLGGKCEICGSRRNLEIDHIDYKKKSFSVGKLWSINNDAFWKEIVKCQLLCLTHHEQKTQMENLKRRNLTHGKEWAAVRHKCTCDKCMKYLASRKKKRKAS